MPCLFLIAALFVPRIVIVLLWFLTGWFRGMFDMILWPILGFVFLPTTLLWYSVVHNWFDGEWSVIPIVGIVIALMIDMSSAEGSRRRERKRRRRQPD
jgi:hypothetical protein